jgi:hypothetical protein
MTNWTQALSGLSSAQANGGGNYFAPGVYLCEVVAITRRESQDPAKKGALLIIGELKVLETVTAFPAEGDLPASNKAGEVCSVICNLNSKFPSMDLGRLKGMLSALLGAVGDEEWAATADAVTAPPGTTLAGGRLVVRASPTTTRAGKRITALSFSPAPAT